MGALRNIFRQDGDRTTAPEMLASHRQVRRKLPDIRRDAGGRSLFEAAVFKDVTLAALLEFEKRLKSRAGRSRAGRAILNQ